MTANEQPEATHCLWWREGRGRKWAIVFRGSRDACAAEEKRLIVEDGWPGDFYVGRADVRP